MATGRIARARQCLSSADPHRRKEISINCNLQHIEDNGDLDELDKHSK